VKTLDVGRVVCTNFSGRNWRPFTFRCIM